VPYELHYFERLSERQFRNDGRIWCSEWSSKSHPVRRLLEPLGQVKNSADCCRVDFSGEVQRDDFKRGSIAFDTPKRRERAQRESRRSRLRREAATASQGGAGIRGVASTPARTQRALGAPARERRRKGVRGTKSPGYDWKGRYVRTVRTCCRTRSELLVLWFQMGAEGKRLHFSPEDALGTQN
jgi:hypothetical protein